MDRATIAHLRAELDAERISYGELDEIQSAFEEIDPATLPDLPENAAASDMLDELEVRATPAAAIERDVYELSRDEFRAALTAVTTPERIYDRAPSIYETMSEIFGQNCNDSVLREWAFEWATDALGRPYEDIHDRWMGEA